jgi:hypothetical protein
MSARIDAVLATVQEFAARTGAERVVALLDCEPPVMVERLEDGTLGRGAAALPLPELRAVPASALSADPETGELSAPLGGVRLLVDSVLALAGALGGRSVATATFPTRNPATPLTVAAREGEPVVLDIAGRHFAFPA